MLGTGGRILFKSPDRSDVSFLKSRFKPGDTVPAKVISVSGETAEIDVNGYVLTVMTQVDLAPHQRLKLKVVESKRDRVVLQIVSSEDGPETPSDGSFSLNSSRIRLQIGPDNLGMMEVVVEYRDKRLLKVWLNVERESSLERLESELNRLVARLKTSLSVEHVEVSAVKYNGNGNENEDRLSAGPAVRKPHTRLDIKA